MIKGYSIDGGAKHHQNTLNKTDEYGLNFRHKEDNKNFFKEAVRHRNMRNSIKTKGKK